MNLVINAIKTIEKLIGLLYQSRNKDSSICPKCNKELKKVINICEKCSKRNNNVEYIEKRKSGLLKRKNKNPMICPKCRKDPIPLQSKKRVTLICSNCKHKVVLR